MEKSCFKYLCSTTEASVGVDDFESEQFLEYLATVGTKPMQSSLYINSKSNNEDYICGKTKVTITLRILTGTSYLDIFP